MSETIGPAWQLQGVDVGYGDTAIVRALSATLPRGAITTVLGPGGSGKSTLLRALEGSTPGLWVRGVLPRVGAWRFPQPCRVRGRALAAEQVESARARIERWLDDHPGALSIDEREGLCSCELALVRASRVLLAAADAELLLLDEPDVHLAGRATLGLAALLRALTRMGSSVVVVTHDLSFVQQIADHLLLLIDGIKLDEGTPARVCERPASERVRSFLTWGT